MKFDYNIVWYEVTEDKLLNQAKYTLQQSQNRIIAENFYEALKKMKLINFLLPLMFINSERRKKFQL